MPTPSTNPDPTGRGWGIESGYRDVWGGWTEAGPDVTALIRRAMGAATNDPAEPPPPGRPLQVVCPGDAVTAAPGTTVLLEDGTEVPTAGGTIPVDLPLGYHRLTGGDRGDGIEHLIVAPPAAPSFGPKRTWGLTAQLYAARSRSSWGIGDFGDLTALTRWATKRGAATIGLNPLHASSPGAPPANSPYSPSTRRWREPIYLAMDPIMASYGMAGATFLDAAEHALNTGERIDRSAVWAAKAPVLEAIWANGVHHRALDEFRARHGEPLTRWGTYGAIAEQHGPSWHGWPAELRRPEGASVAHFAEHHRTRVDFWCWLQWLIEQQLLDARAPEFHVADLAVGFAPDGFDAWEWQDLLAQDFHIGAPPDLLGPQGQDWGLPPFVPARLRDVGYQPFAETIRAVLRQSKGLRIDHVMGLLHLFWVPPGRTAADGAYVSWHGAELLDIVALEATRAGAFVVGEDLGTVDPAIQGQLRDRALLSTRLLWFEDEAPEHWPAQAMAAVTTHDLPTIAGVWSGVSLADRHDAGVPVPDDGDELFRHHLRVASTCNDGAPAADVAVAAHRYLADGAPLLVTAALDDLVGAEHAPNVPGTIDEHPNWRIPLPVALDDLDDTPLAIAITNELRAARPPA